MLPMTQLPDTSPFVVPEWTLGWRLQRALAHAGLTMNDMADEMEVHRATVSRWINDKGAPPRTMYVRQWAIICQVPYEWLSTGETHSENDGPDPDPGTSAPVIGGMSSREHLPQKWASITPIRAIGTPGLLTEIAA